MVQIYCPNCIHQLWGLGRESGGASQSLLGERGWVQDTHPHGPGDRCPLPPHPPCKSTLLPQASGAEIPPPAPGAAALPWGAVGCGWTLGWCQLGYRGVCNSLSPNSPPPPVLAVTGVSLQPPCPCCHTTQGSHRAQTRSRVLADRSGHPRAPHHTPSPAEDSQANTFPAGASGGHWPCC